MPIYQYHCASCGRDLEIFQHMTDPSLTVCPECSGTLRKVFSAVGIVFKGSGFYATDSKKGSSAIASAPATPDSKPASSPSSTTTSVETSTPDHTTPSTTPAASAPAAPAPAAPSGE